MIKLKLGQMEQINAAMMADFQNRVYRYLDDRQADNNRWTQQQLSEFITIGTSEAQRYQLTAEQDIVSFLDIVLFNFGGFTAAFKSQSNQDILLDPYHSTADKLDFLQQSAPQTTIANHPNNSHNIDD